jgi:uncharacterized protein
MDDELLDELWTQVKKKIPAYGCHGIDHTIRVYNLCEKIGYKLNADMEVLLPAAILHDIARDMPNHSINGGKLANQLLSNYNVPKDIREKISHAISTHSFSEKLKPQTLEAMILSDADKLDAIGAVGVYRAATYSSEIHRPIEDFIEHFHEKLLGLKDLLYSDEAKKIAEERHRFLLKYLDQIQKELN